MVIGHEGRAEASMLTLNPLLLMAGGAEVRLTIDHLSTLGCQRRGSIISSRREGEDDDDDDRICDGYGRKGRRGDGNGRRSKRLS